MKELELDNSDKYCVFCCLGRSYALPATSIRSVGLCPALTPVPHTCSEMAGLANVHREFLAVFDLSVALQGNAMSHDKPKHMLVISKQPSQPWGLLVDSVDTLVSLEVAMTGNVDSQVSMSSVCVGSASWGDRFVTVLDPDQLHLLLSEKLNSRWQDMRREIAGYPEQSRPDAAEVLETSAK